MAEQAPASTVQAPASTVQAPASTVQAQDPDPDGTMERRSFVGSHGKGMLRTLNELRRQGLLCDATLMVEDTPFPVHRCILAACSDYFCAMFTSEMSESLKSTIELQGLNARTMEVLLDFIYTETVEVTVENVQELLPSACLLQLSGVEQACCEFLTRQLDATNCLGIRKFADTHACTGLLSAATDFCSRHFINVIQQEEYVTLSEDEVLDLMKRDDLEVTSEEPVFEAVVKWVRHKPDERRKTLPRLLELIRLPLLTPKYITDVVDAEALVQRSHECRDLLDEAKKFHLRPDLRRDMTGPRFFPRTGGDERLIVIGGFGRQQIPLSDVEEFNPKTSEWETLPELAKKRRYLSAVTHDARVYAIGGYDGISRLSLVECLTFTKGQPSWKTLAPLTVKRGLPGAVVLKDSIYVSGGFDGSVRHRSVERYDPHIDQWSVVGDMTTGREGAGLVKANGVLYCVGGYNGNQILDSVEMFDPNSGQWSMVAPMNVQRSGAGISVLNDMIYAFGGYDGAHHLSSVECYNPRTNAWTPVTSMAMSRCYVGSAMIQGKIYAVAGYDGHTLLDSIEIYDPIQDRWTLSKANMAEHRCDAGVAVLRKSDPNINQ